MTPRLIFTIMALVVGMSFVSADKVRSHKFTASAVKDWHGLLKTLEVMKAHNEILWLEIYNPKVSTINSAQATIVAPTSNIDLLTTLAAQAKIAMPVFTQLRRTPNKEQAISFGWGVPERFQKELEYQKGLGTINYQKTNANSYALTGDEEVVKFLQHMAWAGSGPRYDVVLQTDEKNKMQILAVLQLGGITHWTSVSSSKGYCFHINAALHTIQYLEEIVQKDLRDYDKYVIEFSENTFSLVRDELDKLAEFEEALWPVVSVGSKVTGLFKKDVFAWLQAVADGENVTVGADIEPTHDTAEAVGNALNAYSGRFELIGAHTLSDGDKVDKNADGSERVNFLLGYTIKAPSYLVKRLQTIAAGS